MKNIKKNHSKKSVKRLTVNLWAQLLLIALAENAHLQVGHIAD